MCSSPENGLGTRHMFSSGGGRDERKLKEFTWVSVTARASWTMCSAGRHCSRRWSLHHFIQCQSCHQLGDISGVSPNSTYVVVKRHGKLYAFIQMQSHTFGNQYKKYCVLRISRCISKQSRTFDKFKNNNCSYQQDKCDWFYCILIYTFYTFIFSRFCILDLKFFDKFDFENESFF